MKKRIRPEMLLFLLLIAFVALGNGLSDSVFANYFKDAYHVTATQRGFIEFPRELPGLLCAVVIALLSSLGDLRSAIIAQVCSLVGLTALGLLTPSFSVMLIFLFINSMGMHMFMPLQDAIGMQLAEPDQVGKRVGQYSALRSAVGFVAALIVFLGFRLGWFSFTTKIKWIFILGCIAFFVALVFAVLLLKRVNPPKGEKKKIRLVFRKQYKYYYLLTILHGVQKQIAFVYGTWVIVDLLGKGADVMAVLSIVSTFICIFFLSLLGKWMDRFGIKKMMYLDALTFIGVYVLYGFAVWGINSGVLASTGWPVFTIFVLFVLDRLSMQVGIVKSVYLRSIAWEESEVTATLSTGTSLDHVVSIIAAMLGGVVWSVWGSQWVFFIAAAFSLGNLFVAWRVQPDKEKALAEKMRALNAPHDC